MQKGLRLSYHITTRILLRKGTRTNLTHILAVLILRQCISGIADPSLVTNNKKVVLPLCPLKPLPQELLGFLPFDVFWP